MAEKRLIDASALRKRIEMNLRASNPFTIEECCYKDALNSVDEAPTIDPETLRPVAHWDMEEDAVGDPIIWTCSNCKDSIVMYDGAPMENGYKYCPMCGARMEDATNEQAEIS